MPFPSLRKNILYKQQKPLPEDVEMIEEDALFLISTISVTHPRLLMALFPDLDERLRESSDTDEERCERLVELGLIMSNTHSASLRGRKFKATYMEKEDDETATDVLRKIIKREAANEELSSSDD